MILSLTSFLSMIVLMLVNQCVDGFCLRGELKTDMPIAGDLNYYCEYNDGFHVFRMRPGTQQTTTDCLRCSCDMDGLQCCGFGRNAGVVVVPPECKEIFYDCHSFYVTRLNESVDCFTNDPISIPPSRLLDQLLF
ncbi:hypothetical protein CHS0354_038308 [Potamilus streckersoni]|uniref:Uncharacterized protein n=1 Tax=Potamilus streckersoni TaxID=2493646 RepID=A0AAE0TDG5_9BIVA|nr:hypothetical protein CHS0354_038308 [Potamilus streckersoni]